MPCVTVAGQSMVKAARATVADARRRRSERKRVFEPMSRALATVSDRSEEGVTVVSGGRK